MFCLSDNLFSKVFVIVNSVIINTNSKLIVSILFFILMISPLENYMFFLFYLYNHFLIKFSYFLIGGKMKKIILIVLSFLIVIPSFVFAYDGEYTPNATSSILIDYDTKEILYEKNSNKRVSVASLTKMMGLIIIFEKIEDGSLKTNEIITVSKNAKEMGGTQLWLEEGEKISVNDLLKGIIMASANDAMVAMAERVSGTEKAFVKRMNSKAKDLGLKNTHFMNCVGFDEEGAYSTAYDMALISRELLKHKKILDYSSMYESYIRENTSNKTWITNTNKLVKFYKGCDGLKTGYTDNAGSSMAVTATKDGLRLIGILFGYNDTKTRNREAISLLDYGFNQYNSKVLLKKDKVIKKIHLNKADKPYVYLKLNDDLNIIQKIGSKNNNYSYNIRLNKINYPIKKGDTLGYLVLKRNNKKVKELDLVSDKDIKKAGFIKQYLYVIKDTISGNI